MPRCHRHAHFSMSFFFPSVNVFPPHYFTSHLIADRGCCSLTLLHPSLYLFKWMDSPLYDLGEPCEDLLISKWMIFKLAYFLRKWCKDICFWVSSDRVPAVQTPGSLRQSAMQTQANIFLLYKSNHLSVLAVFTKKNALCAKAIYCGLAYLGGFGSFKVCKGRLWGRLAGEASKRKHTLLTPQN